jgi:hypothetical protein
VKLKPGDSIIDRWTVHNLVNWAVGRAGTDVKDLKKELIRDLKKRATDLAGESPSPIEFVLAEA